MIFLPVSETQKLGLCCQESPKLTTHYKVPEDWSWTMPLPARWYGKGAWCSLSMVEEYRTARVGAHRLKEMLRYPRSQSSVEKSQWREFGASSGKHANRSQVQVNFEYCPCPLCWQPNTRRAAMLLGKKPNEWHFLLPYLQGLAFVTRSAKQARIHPSRDKTVSRTRDLHTGTLSTMLINIIMPCRREQVRNFISDAELKSRTY